MSPENASWLEILAREPEHPDALYALGTMALQAGEAPRAAEYLERAVSVRPDRAPFAANLGEAYRRAGRTDEAIATFGRALELDPELGQAFFNLALALRQRGATLRALVCLERAAELLPGVYVVQRELGAALVARGELGRALAPLRRAVALAPQSPDDRVDLATALNAVGERSEAITHYRAALELAPEHALAHNNLGVVLTEAGQLDAALVCLRRAIELAPELAEAHNNLGNVLKAQGLVEHALRSYRRALELAPRAAELHSNLVYTLSFQPGGDDQAILREARRWAERHAAAPTGAHNNDPVPGRRLRLGYVSADFREHVQAMFVLPLLAEHDRQAFEVFCYSNVVAPDRITRLCRERAAHFRTISGLDDGAAAALIRDDGIDVLVDLTMHMRGGRLGVLARRPAPVQLSWLAYPGTTGLGAIDYRLSDPYLDPEDREPVASESTLRLPNTFWCFAPLARGIEPAALPALARGHVTFGCLNNFCKTNDAVFLLWAEVMRGVAGSRLVLLAPEGSARQRVLTTFEQNGVAPERLEFVPFQSRADYLRTYDRIDVGLDTFPYNGHTTSLDSWWMGVPVLTLAGPNVAGRAGLCYALNLGLPEWVAFDRADYVARAQRFAADLESLSELRAGLRTRISRSPLMDTTRFARDLEAAYRSAWRRWCSARSVT